MYGNRTDRSKDSWQIEMRGVYIYIYIYIKIDMYIRVCVCENSNLFKLTKGDGPF